MVMGVVMVIVMMECAVDEDRDKHKSGRKDQWKTKSVRTAGKAH